MSTLLAIDTASPEFAVLVHRDGAVVCSVVRPAGYDHSRLLVPAIAEAMAGIAHLDAVAVVRGPGSYAGIRVGMATASGYALARAIPVVGIATLEAVARAAGPGQWLTVHPAGRETIASQPYFGGAVAGPLLATAAPLPTGTRTAGEVPGATKFIATLQRCIAAAELAAERLKTGAGAAPAALYLREPNITVSRRSLSPAAAT